MIAKTVFGLGLAACLAGVSSLAMAQDVGSRKRGPPRPWMPAAAEMSAKTPQPQMPRQRLQRSAAEEPAKPAAAAAALEPRQVRARPIP